MRNGSFRERARSIAVNGVLALLLGLGLSAAARAEEPIRVGIIGQFSGPFAEVGQQYKQGIETYLALHGTSVGGRPVELLYRDVGGANPANAKRLAEELVVRDKVSVLGGLYLSPESSAVASVSTETKTPTVIFVGSSPAVIRQSPYFVRVGNTSWQCAEPSAEWAFKGGKRRAYIAVADYAPGLDVREAFTRKFTELGGTVVAEDRMPLNTVDFAPFAERIANAKPDVVQMFIPTGAPAVSFVKALAASGILANPNITVIGIDETDEADLHSFDDTAIGVYTSFYYAGGLDNPENRTFKETLKQKFGAGAVANPLNVAAYDGIHVIFKIIASQQGKTFDGTAAIAAVKGYAWQSPRGPVQIEPDTRNITQNIYIRRVEKSGDHLVNAVVATFPQVKDPWGPAHPAP